MPKASVSEYINYWLLQSVCMYTALDCIAYVQSIECSDSVDVLIVILIFKGREITIAGSQTQISSRATTGWSIYCMTIYLIC